LTFRWLFFIIVNDYNFTYVSFSYSISMTSENKPTRTKNPTIHDVANLAGVSTATVSRVLADYEAVSEKTRQKVFSAIEALNYQINRTASNLRRNTISKIGVVITDIQNPFFGTVVRGIEKVTIGDDYTLILGNSDEDPVREQKLITMLLEEGVAGLIFVPTQSDCDSYTRLNLSRTPYVVIDRPIAQCEADTVVVDGYTGSASAVDILVSLGHQRIAYIGGLPHLFAMQERQRGFLEMLHKHGLQTAPELIRAGDNRQAGGYREMQALLALPEPPTAVLIANNLMTLGGLQAIHESGIKIPMEISLIGFDDMDWAPSLQPPLSVVAQPAFEMGERAALALLERIHDPTLPPRHIQLQTHLILRASCQPPPARAAAP
jgi:DNA-binding LacI/PurR family transcriptional regulator